VGGGGDGGDGGGDWRSGDIDRHVQCVLRLVIIIGSAMMGHEHQLEWMLQ